MTPRSGESGASFRRMCTHLVEFLPVTRVVAGLLEVTFVYASQRWVVFARRDRDPAPEKKGRQAADRRG
jgi:hypothetical protein